MSTWVGDHEDVEVTEEFVASVSRHAFERWQEQLQSAQGVSVPDMLPQLVRAAILEAVHQLTQDGFCAYPFHRTEIDEVVDGVCTFCELPEAAHEPVRCCPEPEEPELPSVANDSEEGTAQ